MNNLEVLEEAKKAYNPKNAFGNKKLLSILNKIKVPDDDGYLNITGAGITEIVEVNWECAACGKLHIFKNDDCLDCLCDGDMVEKKCTYCGSEHRIYISKLND